MLENLKIKQLVIVGVGRSGTSLLQSMFAAHPAVAFLPETSFLRRFVAHKKLQSLYEYQGEQAVVDALSSDENFTRTGMDAEKLVFEAFERGRQLDEGVYLAMLEAFRNERESWIGDKDPRAIEYLPLLKSVLPDAHIIHIFRDPRDVLVSKKKAEWSKSGHVWKHIFANRVQFEIGRREGDALFGDSFHEVSYEDLLSSPELVLKKLCGDLEIPFDEQMLCFGDAAKKLVSKEELSWKKETLGPLLSSNKEKWRTELSVKEILLTEMSCGDALRLGKFRRAQRVSKLGVKDWLWVFLGYVTIVSGTIPYIFYQQLKMNKACR